MRLIPLRLRPPRPLLRARLARPETRQHICLLDTYVLSDSQHWSGGPIMKRHKMSSSHSKRSFSKGASYTHKKNMPSRLPMRGGIRL
ncbi:MAG: hypothetical protein [Microviridae sp.]|nr:MAG: hypothetical protein [Microviridae sp.]